MIKSFRKEILRHAMNVEYHKNFEKDVDKLPPAAVKVVAAVVNEIKAAKILRDIKHYVSCA